MPVNGVISIKPAVFANIAGSLTSAVSESVNLRTSAQPSAGVGKEFTFNSKDTLYSGPQVDKMSIR